MSTPATAEIPKEVFSLDEMKLVPNPKAVVPVVEEKKDEVEEKEPEEEVEVKKEEKKEDPAEEEEEEGSEEEPTDKKEETVQEERVGIDDFLKEKYAKQYEISSEKDLDEVLESVDVLIKRNAELEKELETAKTGSDNPKFASEAQAKLWDFVKDVDPARIGDRMQVYSRLVGMDVEKENPRLLLEEQFILEHPELPRDRALKKFNYEYNQQYGELNRDNFDTDEAFKDAKELREINQEDAVHKARKVIKTEQAKLKTETKTQTEDKTKENPTIKKSVTENVSTLDANMKDFNELIFSFTDKDEDDIAFKFTADQKKLVHSAYKAWIGNPVNYNEKGEFVAGDIDFTQNVKQTAYLLFGDDIVETLHRRIMDLKDITRAEEIATKKPDRKAKVAGDDVGKSLSEEKQWEMAINKKKANTGSKSMVMR